VKAFIVVVVLVAAVVAFVLYRRKADAATSSGRRVAPPAGGPIDNPGVDDGIPSPWAPAVKARSLLELARDAARAAAPAPAQKPPPVPAAAAPEAMPTFTAVATVKPGLGPSIRKTSSAPLSLVRA
jgi:hypothetical protein